MVNYSLTDLSASNAGEHNENGFYNDTEYNDDTVGWHYDHILAIFTLLICTFGILGNGLVIWVLGFSIKKNPFTTYILNLAIADFAFLTTAIIEVKLKCSLPIYDAIVISLFYFVHFSMFSASQYLLTVTSLGRCFPVFFPLWHRFHRPSYLSAIFCALIWVVSFLPPAISFILYMENIFNFSCVIICQFIANCFLCLPLMFISSLMLFIKVCCKTYQQRRGKFLITILATVFFLLFLSFLFNVVYAIYFFFYWDFNFYNCVKFCACLNSSVNPLIYYLVGRQKKDVLIKA